MKPPSSPPPETPAGSPSGIDDWRFYLRQMEANNWEYFRELDGRAFQAALWPLLADPELGNNPDFLLVCGAGLVNWACRNRSLSAPEMEACRKESLPLLLKAAGLGSWLAMTETALMYRGRLDIARDADQSIHWAGQAVELCERRFGQEHLNTAIALQSLANALSAEGKSGRATPLFERILQIREKALGPEHPDTVTSLNNLAMHYKLMRDCAQAEPLLLRALKIREKVLGPEHLDTAASLSNLASLYLAMGDHAQAESLYQRTLKIREKIQGPEHLETADSLKNLARLYTDKGDHAKAEPVYRKALRIWEKERGPEHFDTVMCLIELARLYKTLGQYSKAEPLQHRVLQFTEKRYGPENVVVVGYLKQLAEIYQAMGDYTKAEPLYQRALQILEKERGPERRSIAPTLHDLASVYERMKDYASAESHNHRALQIFEKEFGPDHENTAASLNNLGMLYYAMGDYDKAQPLFQRALQISEKVLGVEHPSTTANLNNLAMVFLAKGDYAQAEPVCQRALEIREKVLGPEHPETATTLNNLAAIHGGKRDHAQAERFFRRALHVQEKVLGPNHPDTALTLHNLSQNCQVRDAFAEAETLLRRALEIWEKVFGSEHPSTGITQERLALLLLGLNRPTEALKLARRACDVEFKSWTNILSFTSESQRLAYQHASARRIFTLLAALVSAPDLALAVLRFKGVVLDSLLEDRLVAQASDQPETRALVDQLRSLKHRLNQLVFETPTDLSDPIRLRRESETKRLTQEAEQLESTLARHVAGLGRARRSLSVTVEQVQEAIPKEAVLLEWLRYEHYLGKHQAEKRYGVIVLASSGEPKWISLGSAEAIETNIEQYRAAMRGESGDAGPKSEVQSPKPMANANPNSEVITQKSEIEPLLRRIHEQLWSPLESLLPPGTKTVILSPDGVLNFLSFATLLTPDDQFLSQKYSIRYVASGRDLLREFQSPASSQVTVFANPDFSGQGSSSGTSPDEPGRLRLVEMRDFQHLELPSLPGTARESAALAAQAQQWNWPIAVFEGAEANQTRLREVSSPRILHLATHGFFLPESEIEKHERVGTSQRGVGGVRPFEESGFMDESSSILKPRMILKNPMHRSGLALAGAQTTLNAWQRGETSAVTDDGIVTAEEVGTLKLEGTQLVVLSACDTGAGEARSGEGVLGLRRGFIQAGAKNLMMTLWCVADEETVEIMADFYETFHSSGNAPQALADVQREWLVRLRQERGLQSAVALAGPFILSSQGPLA